MSELEHPDSFHLQAAQGWLELGDLNSAMEELDCITPELRAHPSVLIVRSEIYRTAQKWQEMLTVAIALVKAVPKDSRGWISRSFALHAMKRTEEAYQLLRPGIEAFPTDWLVRYNLACYCAQLGRITAAEAWFKQAMAMNEKEVKVIALDDPDLDPLWTGMQGTVWKRTG